MICERSSPCLTACTNMPEKRAGTEAEGVYRGTQKKGSQHQKGRNHGPFSAYNLANGPQERHVHSKVNQWVEGVAHAEF